jgi:hypothetical protein
MAEIRADLSQYYAMKSLLERVLGRSSFRRVKDYAPLAVWKVEARKLIKAIALSIEATVLVVDDEWKDEVKSLLDHGVSRVEMSASVDQLFASLAATFGELALLQVGFVPRGHSRVDRVPLIAQNWKLDPVRSVQYVQSAVQRATQARLRKRGTQNGET